MSTDEIQVQIDELDGRLDRLRALYEQYFAGIERLEPLVPRKDVERRFQALRRIQLKNTAQRFKFQTLWQKYTTYLTYWGRIARQIEEGRYKRDILRAQKRLEQGARSGGEESEQIFELDDTELEDLEDVLEEDDTPTEPPPPAMMPKQVSVPASARIGIPREELPLDLDLEGLRKPEPQRPAQPVAQAAARPSLGPTPPATRSVAAPVSSPRPAAAESPRAPAAAPARAPEPAVRPAAAATKPAASPAAAPAPRAVPSATASASPTAKPAPAAAKPAPSEDPAIRALYDRYRDARRKQGEGDVSYEALAKQVRETMPRLAQKYPGQEVALEVAVKEGKTILRPVLKAKK